jgi:Ca2+-binding EF-hand superfamily protein
MSVSSVYSSSSYSYLQWPLQSDGADSATAGSVPSDPLQALYQAFSGGNGGDPLMSALAPDDGSVPSSNAPQFGPDVMQALLSVQGDQSGGRESKLESLLGKFDANGDGQMSQTEFENAVGPNADQSKVDALFNKLDANGDGSVTKDELQSALQKVHGGHHHHHGVQGANGQGGDPLQSLLLGTAADGTTGQSTANSDGSTTTTITYADGTKVEMTTPAATGATGSAAGGYQALTFSNLLKQLISLQAQWAAPTTNLSA